MPVHVQVQHYVNKNNTYCTYMGSNKLSVLFCSVRCILNIRAFIKQYRFPPTNIITYRPTYK